MRFGYLGVNYRDAELAVRDRISFTDDGKLAFFQKAEAAGVGQCMALSTCNRSEVYFFYENEAQKREIRRIYEKMFSETDLHPYLRERSGKEAVEYLFRVAAGLESLVLGEDQILGQVKDALDYSRTMGYAGKELHKIVRDAVTCAKQIKTEWKISEKPLSVSYIGIKSLEKACGIAGKKILVIGSGKTASLALQYLFEYEKVKVTACSRNRAHADRLREAFPEISVIPYDLWRGMAGQCDIIISATSSPHFIIRKNDIVPDRRITILDLAAPRDVETEISRHPHICLINLDTLQAAAEENQKKREILAEKSRGRIEEAAEEAMDWFLKSRMDAAIESLQIRCASIVEDSFLYLDRKMDFNEREKKLVKKVLNASLQRLLREPIQEMKRLDSKEDQEEYKQMIRQLFQI